MKIAGILFCFFLLIGIAESGHAQMTAAKRLPPAVEKKVVLSVPAQKVWDYVSEPANYKKFSGVREFTCEEKALNAKIQLTTQKSQRRDQYISVLDYDQYRICYFVTHSDYDGKNPWVYSLDVVPQGEKKCTLVVSVYHAGEPLSSVFEKGITEEFNDIIKGVSRKFK